MIKGMSHCPYKKNVPVPLVEDESHDTIVAANIADKKEPSHFESNEYNKRVAFSTNVKDPASKRLRSNSESNKIQFHSDDVLGHHPAEVTFFRLLHAELQKAVRFYGQTIQEFRIRVERLQEGSCILKQPSFLIVPDRWPVLARSSFKVYKDLLLLETYSIMTYCAFSKILKKHDKVTGRSTRNAFMKSMVSTANFSDTTRLLDLIDQCYQIYNEASEELAKVGRAKLQDDEKLFIDSVRMLGQDIMLAASNEGAPIEQGRVARALKQIPTEQGGEIRRTM